MSYINATQYFSSIDCQEHHNTTVWKADNVKIEKDVCVSFRMGDFVGGYEMKEDNEIQKIRLFENAMEICKNPLTEWYILNDTNCFNINFQSRNESFKIEIYNRQFKSDSSIVHTSILFIIIIHLLF